MPISTYDMSASFEREHRPRPSNRQVDYIYLYQRRLIKSTPHGPLPPDSAGLASGSRYHGRDTPLRGKGLPPADGQEAPSTPPGGIRTQPATWCPPTDVLNTRRPLTPDDVAVRPHLRAFGGAYDSSMRGAAAEVVVESAGMRPIRRHGTQAPQDDISSTRRRVLADSVEADSSVEWWAEQRPSSVRSWQLPSRPVTADSIIHHRIHNDRGDPRKLDSARMASPTITRPTAEASKAVYTAAIDGYCANKARSIYGSTFRFG